MATREWSERHIVELIKKHGGEGDPLVTVSLPTLNFKESNTPGILRLVTVTVNTNIPSTGNPVATYYTVTNAGSANDRPMAASNFKAGQPFVGFMWPRSIQSTTRSVGVRKPWWITEDQTLDVIAVGGRGVTHYTMGEASFRMTRATIWGIELNFSNKPHLSGAWGGINDDNQHVWALEIKDNGVSTLVDNYIAEFDEKPSYLTAWHVNTPAPIP